MDIQELLNLYTSHSGITALHQLIQADKDQNISLKGLNGSAPAMMVAALFKKGNNRFICLLNDLEEAGYFLIMIETADGDESIYFFPSAYRRDIKYGHIDAANEILRTVSIECFTESGSTVYDRFLSGSHCRESGFAGYLATKHVADSYG